jgi:hypothetical protein
MEFSPREREREGGREREDNLPFLSLLSVEIAQLAVSIQRRKRERGR